MAFMNVGYFFKAAAKRDCRSGAKPPDFLTIPSSLILQGHRIDGGWEKFYTRGMDLKKYTDEVGFEQIAKVLRITYPEKARKEI
jgi:hypothetical protein